MEPLDRIPDGIEPIVGYRGWIYALHGTRPQLHPMRPCGHATGPSPWDGAESGWVFASCAADPGDPEHVPGWSCTCGFYATKNLPQFLPKAFVDLKPGMRATEAELIAFTRERMAHFKCPSAIEFGPLPKTSTGKVQKFVLRDREWSGKAKRIN